MRRLSVPMDSDVLEEFNKRIPWGLRHHLVRSLITMALRQKNVLELAVSEGEGYDIVKEAPLELNTSVESRKV